MLKYGGVWVDQSVERLTSAQVMISHFMGLSPRSGSVLTAQSLELLQIQCLPSDPVSAPHPLVLHLFLSLKNKNKHKNIFKMLNYRLASPIF